jgi:hypothetical protein
MFPLFAQVEIAVKALETRVKTKQRAMMDEACLKACERPSVSPVIPQRIGDFIAGTTKADYGRRLTAIISEGSSYPPFGDRDIPWISASSRACKRSL